MRDAGGPSARVWLASRGACSSFRLRRRKLQALVRFLMKRPDKIAYSSGPQGSGDRCPRCGWPVASCACAKKEETAGPLAAQRVRVSRTSAGRGGKTVTLVAGVEGGDAVLARLAKKLKTRCGAGGTVKEGAIEIQGDHVETAIALLSAEGYRPRRSGG